MPSERPLAGRSVVVCRAAADAAGLIGQLHERGADVVAVPLHRRVPPGDGGIALRAALGQADRYTWMAVTSANGVRAVIEAARTSGADLSGLRLAAVGPATAAALADAGLTAELVPPVATAADLAQAFPPPQQGDRVLTPLAAAAGDDLELGLAALGYHVDRVDAYDMAEPDPLPGQFEAVAGADAVVLTAPSLVDRFVDRFPDVVAAITAVCIGPRTTARAQARGLERVVEAGESSEAGLIQAVTASLPPVRAGAMPRPPCSSVTPQPVRPDPPSAAGPEE